VGVLNRQRVGQVVGHPDGLLAIGVDTATVTVRQESAFKLELSRPAAWPMRTEHLLDLAGLVVALLLVVLLLGSLACSATAFLA
jgi:hypothetical protein